MFVAAATKCQDSIFNFMLLELISCVQVVSTRIKCVLWSIFNIILWRIKNVLQEIFEMNYEILCKLWVSNVGQVRAILDLYFWDRVQKVSGHWIPGSWSQFIHVLCMDQDDKYSLGGKFAVMTTLHPWQSRLLIILYICTFWNNIYAYRNNKYILFCPKFLPISQLTVTQEVELRMTNALD